MSFVALPLDALLAAQGEWIERIRLCYGTDRLRFEQEVLRMIRGLAAYVHQLPASRNEAFREPGGLLQLSLQTAFYSLQGSDGQIFSGKASLVARRHLEPRWRLATLIAGLCAETHRPLGQMRVSSANGAHWPAALQPLLLKSAAVHVHPEAHGLWTISPPGQASTFTALKLVDSPHLLDLLPADRKPLKQNLVFATSPAASPPQLVLPLESEAPLTAPAPQPENPAPLTLNAPLRLNPAVQQALANTLHTFQVCPIAEGLFVPLHALESQGIKAATAIRALNELSMLIHSAQHEAPTHSREVDGRAITGVIIDPRYIAGLPPKPVAETVA